MLLRFYNLGGYAIFLGDQGRDAIILKRILTLEHFPSIGAPSSVGQIYLGPFYYYFIAPFLALFRFDPVGPVFGVALLSVLGAICFYYVLQKETISATAQISIVLLTFSSSLIDLSRFSWNPNLLPYFSFFSLYFFYKMLQLKSKKYAFVFGSLFAFSIQLHYLAGLILIPIVLWFVIFENRSIQKRFFKNVETRKLQKDIFGYDMKSFHLLIISIVSFVFFSLPLLFFDLRHGFLNSKNFIALFQSGGVVATSSYATRLIQTARAFVSFSFGIDLHGIIAIAFLSTLSIICLWVSFKKKAYFISLLSISVIPYLVTFALLESPRIIHYFGPVYGLVYVLVAFAITHILQRKTMVIGAIAFIAFFVFQWPHYYFHNSPNNQIEYAKKVAKSFEQFIENEPIQIVPLPFTETDGHFRYFLEMNGYDLLPHDSSAQAEELYVMCFTTKCNPTGDPHWQIASFYQKKVESIWEIEHVKIYKFIHETDN